jgi:hypothetical protein
MTDNTLHLSASRLQVVTRSGDEDVYFDEGTFYRLFAADSGKCDWGILNNSLGVETEGHEIMYNLTSTSAISGSTASYPTGGKADIYGVTFGMAVDPLEYSKSVSVGEESPTLYKVAYDASANSIPDLLFSNNLKNITSENEGTPLKFRHSLSSIKFKISRQEQDADKVENGTSKDLAKVTLKKIEVIEPKSEGTFDIVTGKWSYEENTESNTRTFYELEKNADPISIPVETNGAYAEVPGIMSIFPNEDYVTIRITLMADETEVVEDYKITSGTFDKTLDEMVYSYFPFESNYQYTLSILLLESGMRVIAIIPEKYEWIDYDVASIDAYLGQPVTFNGIMWMDRNLGAKTADCENDFYGSIGYYYQYGRNIPYILDTEKFKHFIDDDGPKEYKNNIYFMTSDTENNKLIGVVEDITKENNANYKDARSPYYQYYYNGDYNSLSKEEKATLEEEQLQSVYTYDHKGEKVYGIRQVSHESALKDTLVIRNPGDVIYKIGEDGKYVTDENGNKIVDDDLTREYYKFSCVRDKADNSLSMCHVWTNYDGALAGGQEYYGRDMWLDTNNQPCPKGWRLPTKEDALNFMPSSRTDWYNYSWPTYSTGTKEQRYYGKVNRDDGGTYYIIYMMKNVGTDQAYRIRIQTCFCTGTTKKRYVRIDRFTAEKDRKLASYLNIDASNNDLDNQNSSEWATPIETIRFPCAGFIVTDYRGGTSESLKGQPVFPDMRSFGAGVVLRTSESAINDSGSTDKDGREIGSRVIYLATQSLYVQIPNTSRRSLGDQIRCVRDISTTSDE